MLSKQRGLFCRSLFESCNNPPVKLQTLAPQQAAVCRVSNQRVLIHISGLRRTASAKHERSVAEARQGRLQIAVSFLRNGRQRFVGKFTTKYRTDLGNLFCVPRQADQSEPSATHTKWEEWRVTHRGSSTQLLWGFRPG